MMDHDRCPDCRSFDTEQDDVHWYATEIEETRTCQSCSMRFNNTYELSERELL